MSDPVKKSINIQVGESVKTTSPFKTYQGWVLGSSGVKLLATKSFSKANVTINLLNGSTFDCYRVAYSKRVNYWLRNQENNKIATQGTVYFFNPISNTCGDVGEYRYHRVSYSIDLYPGTYVLTYSSPESKSKAYGSVNFHTFVEEQYV